MTEVEAQSRRRILRTGLCRILRDDVAQARVHHVRGRVGTSNRQTALAINLGVCLLAHRYAALGESAAVNAQATDRCLHIVNLNNATASETDRTVVGQLATHFGVEGRAIEDHLDLRGCACSGCRNTVNEQRFDSGLGGLLRVAQESRAATHRLLDVVEDADISVSSLLRTGVGACAFLLLGHEAAEALLVDGHALFGSHLEGQVNRESVGVVQRERRSAGNNGGSLRLLRTGNRGVQDRRTGAQRATESVFLRVGDLRDRLPVGLELGVGRLHRVLGSGEEGWHGCLVDAQQAHGANSTTDQTTQHVAAAIVTGTHAIADQHERGTHVVGHDTHAHVIVIGGTGLGTRSAQTVALATHLHGSVDDGEHLVDLVHVGLVLHDEGQTFEACARINRLLVELAQQRVVLTRPLTAHVLVEDQVPDLKVAVATRVNSAAHGLGTVLGAAIIVPLRTGAGGTRLAGVPEVFLTRQAHDVLGIHADLLGQDVEGFLVLVPQRHPEAITVEAVHALVARTRQQLPGVVDRAFLEVVAEREVAVHLEERAVTRRLTDVIDVVRANTLLHRRSTRPRRGLNTRDIGDERNHARDREQNRGLRGDKRNGRTNLMPLLLEVFEPAGADFRRTHSSPC